MVGALWNIFDDAVRNLPPRQQVIDELRRIDGLGLKATAECLGLSVSSVKKLQLRAMRQLTAAMAEFRGGAEEPGQVAAVECPNSWTLLSLCGEIINVKLYTKTIQLESRLIQVARPLLA